MSTHVLHISFASPTGPKLPITVKQLSTDARKRQVSSCSSNVDPACLEALYGIPTTPATEASNYIVVTGYDDQYPSTSDLEVRIMVGFEGLSI